MKIKICGVTTPEDAQDLDKQGVDFIGVNFSKHSKRCISLARAEQIASAIKQACLVGVFVETEAPMVKKIVAMLPLKMIQIYHPQVSLDEELLENEQVKIIYAYQVASSKIFTQLKTRRSKDLFLFDGYSKTEYGGSGTTFAWDWIPKQLLPKAFIAGGITSELISKLARHQPYAIDVCSGVESKPGIKDREKIQQLLREVRRHAT